MTESHSNEGSVKPLKSSAKHIKMKGFDDLLGLDSEEERLDSIPLNQLTEFQGHPFQVTDDEKMLELVDSIQERGVLMPIIVRSIARNKYEIISGHRRVYACRKLEISVIPAVIRDLDDETSTIIMVDSNIQRETLLLSEKAFAYRMKLEAIKRKAGRPKAPDKPLALGSRLGLEPSQENSRQVGENLSIDIISQGSPDSARNIQRIIRLTELIPDLLNAVDVKKLPFNNAVELSYLQKDEQQLVLEVMLSLPATPTLEQASKLRQYSALHELNEEKILATLVAKKPKTKNFVIKSNVAGYFPKGTSKKEMEETILSLLGQWQEQQKGELS